MNLPDAFTKKMKVILGNEYEDFFMSYEEPRKFGLRVNTAKISPDKFEHIAPFGLKKIPWIPNGFYYQEGDMPSRHPFYYAGLYYLQEPSAMTPASRLPVAPGERVLDLCAAPGGKATELGARLKGEGLLVANDISASRARALLKNIEVFGIPNSFLINEVPARIADQFEEFFDKILVDAPCSGEGMFRKDPDVAKAWDQEKPAACARIQQDIVRQAVRMLRPGGVMLYSTCTFSPEENEQIIAGLLREDERMSLLEMEGYEGFAQGRPDLADGNEELKKCVRIWPHRMAGEGHFMALLKKQGSGEQQQIQMAKAAVSRKKAAKAGGRESGRRAGMTRQDREILGEFFQDVHMGLSVDQFEVRKGQVYSVSPLLGERKGIPFLRNGLYLGELKKDRFEPSQAFAVALRKREYVSTVNLNWTDSRVSKYLKGETIAVDDVPVTRARGWQLVCVNGYPLGWGKLSNGLLKNKYLASWRMKN